MMRVKAVHETMHGDFWSGTGSGRPAGAAQAEAENTRSCRRAAIVQEARRWLGTPYRHQASVRGVGCDCLGLVRGVWRALHGPEPERPPPYAPDWVEASGLETFRDAARRHLREIPLNETNAGDVLLFRFRDEAPARHCAILTGKDQMIHAHDGHVFLFTAIY